MKTILLWDSRFPDRKPTRLTLDDAVAAAAVRSGAAAAANPAEAGELGAGGALDPGMLTEVMIQHGRNGGGLSRVFLPYSVVLVGAAAGVLASIGTPIAGGATPTPSPTIIPLIAAHGDSRVVGIFAKQAQDTDYARVSQHVVGDRSYPLAAGINAVTLPLEQEVDYTVNGSQTYLSPLNWAMRTVADAFPSAPVVLIAANGHNGTSIASAGHIAGPLPDSQTAHFVSKSGAARAALAAAQPNATIAPVIVTIDVTNDMLGSGQQGAPTAAVVYAAKLQQLIDLRTASGFATAPIVVVGTLPETQASYGASFETAQKVAALKTPGAYYVRLPSGTSSDNIHEGKDLGGGTFDLSGVRTVGTDHIGRAIKVAFGAAPPIQPVLNVAPTSNREEGTTSPIPLGIDQPAYWSIDPATSDGSGSLSPAAFALSGDLASAAQELLPAGGTWPAFDGAVPANNTKRVKLNYITGDRVTGSVTIARTVTQAVVVPYLVYDDFNRADVAPASGALGNTPGYLGQGGGKVWRGDAGVSGNKLVVGKTDYSRVNCYAIVDAGAMEVEASVVVNLAGNKPMRLMVGVKYASVGTSNGEEDTVGYVCIETSGRMFYRENGSGKNLGTGQGGVNWQQSTFADLGYSGTHTLKIRLKTENGKLYARGYVDGTLVAQGVPEYGDINAAALGTYAGVSVDFANFDIRADQFTVMAA